jgi:hypothetical protein
MSKALLLALALALWNASSSRPATMPIMIAVAAEATPGPARGNVWVVVGLSEHVEVPRAFAEATDKPFDCESEWVPGAVNPRSGARGQAQIHPVHFPRMRALGLDPGSEGDLMKYALVLWKEQGLGPWESSRECWEGE